MTMVIIKIVYISFNHTLFNYSLDLVLSPSAEGNKGPVGEEEDDAAAAVKIQVIR
jgi:hypothetical protein